MPISIHNESDGRFVSQSFESPTVYMDHWALRLFSDDLSLQSEFVRILKKKNGTLVLSNFSFTEFARATDSRHARDTELFIERLLPNLFLTNFDLEKLRQEQLAQSDNSTRFPPSTDWDQLKLLVTRASDTPAGFTFLGFISLAHEFREEINKTLDEAIAMLVTTFENERLNPTFKKKAKSVFPSLERTRIITIQAELMRDLILDAKSPIRPNDVVDFIHASIPIDCCDFVLLDNAWAARADKLAKRLSAQALAMPLAKWFSRRDDGIKRFLTALEGFPNP